MLAKTMNDFNYKSAVLGQYDLADKTLRKVFDKLELENDSLIRSKHYYLNGSGVDTYGNVYDNQVKINKDGYIFLSRRHVGEICNSTENVSVEGFVKSDGSLDELTNTIFEIASDIAEAQKTVTHSLSKFLMTLEALL